MLYFEDGQVARQDHGYPAKDLQLLGGWSGGAGHTPWFPPRAKISLQLPGLLPWLRRKLGSQHTFQGPGTFQSPGHSRPDCWGVGGGAEHTTDRTLTSAWLPEGTWLPLLAKSVTTKNSQESKNTSFSKHAAQGLGPGASAPRSPLACT